ncbi:MATE family efflux transporter [Polyangium jinanense]|uniref:MATE family efflux transporter n=1 Tax=Polyangium jinanense TaxID=2829994 RepID=A0A9X4AW49_9BACT|nr:MATE family efflux transporter [Polyangium jinanense]MDC3960645.1 MATE family efflux transporter [Polyangium jinanense]MDC3986933.1 MATE family efflux transporter [Polyangium jinanense]
MVAWFRDTGPALVSPKPPPTNLLTDPIPKALVRLAVPMTLSIVLMMLAGIADTFFVGRLGPRELAVMSFAFPVIALVMSVAFGLNVGSAAAISRAVGGGDTGAARRLCTHAMLLALLVVAVLSALGMLFGADLFRALGADEPVVALLSSYMNIWFGGVVFLVVPMVGNGAMQATGDSKTPAKIMAVFAVMNVALDPLLIFGAGPIPALGLRGAALASVLARGVTMCISLWVLGARLELLDLHVPTARELFVSFRQILSVGLPAAVSNALTPISTALVTGFIARYGSDAVAAYGLGSRLDGLLVIPSMALSMALTPFIGQNWGAHREDRVAQALSLAQRIVVAWGAVVWTAMLILRRPLASVFSSDDEVLGMADDYLLILPLAYGATGIVAVTSSTFNAIDRAVRSTVISAMRGLFLALPLAVLGARIAGVRGLFVGLATATVTSAAVAVLWARAALGPKDNPAVSRTSEGIVGLEGAREAAIDELLAALDGIDGVVACARPINTIGFYLKGRELGHVHRNGHIDLHVPGPVHDQLLTEGRAVHHRSQHGTSWISHDLFGAADAREAVWLLELTTILARIGQRGGEVSAADREALATLSPSPSLMRAVEQSFGAGGGDVPRAAIAA